MSVNKNRVAEIVQRTKAEIIADVVEGHVPSDVKNFSELHDYVDANTYGGLCDEDNEVPFEPLDEINEIQNAVSDWIESGQLKADLEDHLRGE